MLAFIIFVGKRNVKIFIFLFVNVFVLRLIERSLLKQPILPDLAEQEFSYVQIKKCFSIFLILNIFHFPGNIFQTKVEFLNTFFSYNS